MERKQVVRSSEHYMQQLIQPGMFEVMRSREAGLEVRRQWKGWFVVRGFFFCFPLDAAILTMLPFG
jgi:hypothetical protein